MDVIDERAVLSDVEKWKGLVLLAAWMAAASVAMIVVQIGIYLVWSLPETTAEFFELLIASPV